MLIDNDNKMQAFFAIIIFTISCLFTVANYYLAEKQQVEFLKKNERIRIAKELKIERFKLFNQINKLVGERLYLSRRFLGAVQNQLDFRARGIEKRYLACRDKWNFNVYRNLSLISHYFGKELREEFEGKISNKLVAMGTKIEKAFRNKSKPKKIKCLELKTIPGDLLRFNKKALQKIEGR